MAQGNENKLVPEFQGVRSAVAAARRTKRPTPPHVLFDDLMRSQDMQIEDVCKKSGLSVDCVRGLRSGEYPFDAVVEEHLLPWLGEGAKALTDLQQMQDYFKKFEERPPFTGRIRGLGMS